MPLPRVVIAPATATARPFAYASRLSTASVAAARNSRCASGPLRRNQTRAASRLCVHANRRVAVRRRRNGRVHNGASPASGVVGQVRAVVRPHRACNTVASARRAHRRQLPRSQSNVRACIVCTIVVCANVCVDARNWRRLANTRRIHARIRIAVIVGWARLGRRHTRSGHTNRIKTRVWSSAQQRSVNALTHAGIERIDCAGICVIANNRCGRWHCR